MCVCEEQLVNKERKGNRKNTKSEYTRKKNQWYQKEKKKKTD